MKYTLKKCVIAVAGDFGPERSIENIKRWIQLNGGIFTNYISPQTTYLVCSKKQYGKNSTMGVSSA